MYDFKKLECWKRGMDLVAEIYLCTREFPDTEKYGLTSQLRRASVSIPANLAEAGSRMTSKDIKRFVEVSIGSAFEVETLLILAERLEFGPSASLQETQKKVVHLQRMLRKLHLYYKNVA